MKLEQLPALIAVFEGHTQQADTGEEYWLACHVQHSPSYSE